MPKCALPHMHMQPCIRDHLHYYYRSMSKEKIRNYMSEYVESLLGVRPAVHR